MNSSIPSSNMKVLGVIPSRFGSTRFPGKPLIDILGKTMIQRVYEQVSKSKILDQIVVATDDKRIFDHVVDFGGKVILTSKEHATGTDRCNEVAGKMTGFDVIINIQGDEPLIDAKQIDRLALCFEKDDCHIATLVQQISDESILYDSSRVKVVKTLNDRALYFSRRAIPHQKLENETCSDQHRYWQHIGIYGYRTSVLEIIANLPMSILEKAESLEQLRWLENGFDIYVAETEHDSISVDIPEDLARIEAIIQNANN